VDIRSATPARTPTGLAGGFGAWRAGDTVVDAMPPRTGWAGQRAALEESFLSYDGGPIVLAPCEERVVAVRFLVLGGFVAAVRHPRGPGRAERVTSGQRGCGTGWEGTGRHQLPGFYGTDSLVHIGNGGWTAPCDGEPGASGDTIIAWWVAAANRATAAPYDVHHLGGTTRVTRTRPSTAAHGTLGSFDFGWTAGKSIGRMMSRDAVRVGRCGPPGVLVVH